MASKRAKGLLFQKWIQKYLEARKWVVHNQPLKSTRVMTKKGLMYVSQAQDIFGVIDLIGKKQGISQTVWIQATLDTNIGRKNKELAGIPWGISDEGEVWVKRADGHVDIFSRQIDQTLRLTGKIVRGAHQRDEEGGPFGIDYGKKKMVES